MKWLFFLPLSLFAVDLKPWFSPSFEFEPKAAYTYSQYTHVNSFPYNSHDQFFNLSLGFTYFTTNLQLEFQTAQTRAVNFGPDFFMTTGRKLLLDDVSGQDPVSLAVGLSLVFPWAQSLADPSCFHHSKIDGELFLSVGKELSCGPFWDWRFYNVCGFGTGIKGSPWIRDLLAIEKNFYNVHCVQLKLHFLKGFGNSGIASLVPFGGYYNINHNSLDLLLGYSYTLFPYATLSLDYTQRIYSWNAPKNIHAGTISLLFPFGL